MLVTGAGLLSGVVAAAAGVFVIVLAFLSTASFASTEPVLSFGLALVVAGAAVGWWAARRLAARPY